MCSKHGVVFFLLRWWIVALLISFICLVLYLVLSLLAKWSNLKLETVGSKKHDPNLSCCELRYGWSRVAMIFSYVKLDIRSISFLKIQKNKVKFLNDMKIPIQSHMLFILKTSTYATCYLIELCQMVVSLCEIHFILPWSRSCTHLHHTLSFYTRR
jgi:hypothetical protein